jgi:hypothetical protein
MLLLGIGLVRAWTLSYRLQASQANLEARIVDCDTRLKGFEQRLDHVKHFSDAHTTDTRSQHEGEMVELLESLLQINESLQRPASRGANDRQYSLRTEDAS